jgi:ankyrin repeat protein
VVGSTSYMHLYYYSNCIISKRDVQKQLEVLLQNRPNMIRSRGVMTKIRLQILREYRDYAVSSQPNICVEDSKERNIKEAPYVAEDVWLQLFRSEAPTTDFSWIQLDPEIFPRTNADNSFGLSYSHDEIDSNTLSPAGIGVALPDYNALHQTPDVVSPEALEAPSLSNILRLHSDPCSVNSASIPPDREDSNLAGLPGFCAQADVLPQQNDDDRGAELLGAASRPLSQVLFDSTVSADAMSYQASVTSLQSLRKRLSRKTESCIGEIVSLVEHFTISGLSTLSGQRVRQPLPDTGKFQASNFSEHTKEHSMLLPGLFSTHSWDEFGEDSKTEPDIRRYSLKRRPPPSRPKPLSGTGYEWTSMIKSVLDETIHPKDNQHDVFGNSALHIAAALGKSHDHLRHLLDLDANMHTLNSGNQTFLHLLQPFSTGSYLSLHYLLERLRAGNFNFHQRDDHGQTPLHYLITGHWNPWLVLNGISDWLCDLEIIHLLSRDNLGRTIIGQLTERGLAKSEINRLQQRVGDLRRISRNSCESAVEHAEVPHLPNYGNQTSIETMEDLLVYEQYADLLRSIVKSCEFPEFEDTNGRNGLHCLAEARNLPLPSTIPGHKAASDIALSSSRREAYLKDLILTGVDADNHDHLGLTPLMAFILHIRDDEDDEATTRILSRLCDASASINRRNREGETPLHIAVKMGRRAATKFLICRKANVHARDRKGMGIVALGMEQSKRATKDEGLYARIMLCVSLVIDAGAVSAPTTLQEWTLPSTT